MTAQEVLKGLEEIQALRRKESRHSHKHIYVYRKWDDKLIAPTDWIDSATLLFTASTTTSIFVSPIELLHEVVDSEGNQQFAHYAITIIDRIEYK